MLFGKTLNSIDLPFLKRDLGYDFMNKYFDYHVLDLTSITHCFTDMGILPNECTKSSKLMKYLELGKVKHTSLMDAQNTALMYLKLLEKFSSN